ncbi:MAG: thermostable hemolysin [Panacagrimonas sp.]
MAFLARQGIVEAEGPDRPALEQFIADRYRQVHGAHLQHFMPRLFGFYEHDELIAAFGLRSAGQGALFLERYLDESVEACVHRHSGQLTQRARIAEVGNLAGSTPGALRSLIPSLTHLLCAEGFAWLSFTGSARLCNGFTRLGLPLSVVAPATPDRLPENERRAWGHYYEHAPSVMLGDVERGARSLRESEADPRALQKRLAPVARIGAP